MACKGSGMKIERLARLAREILVTGLQPVAHSGLPRWLAVAFRAHLLILRGADSRQAESLDGFLRRTAYGALTVRARTDSVGCYAKLAKRLVHHLSLVGPVFNRTGGGGPSLCGRHCFPVPFPSWGESNACACGEANQPLLAGDAGRRHTSAHQWLDKGGKREKSGGG